MEIETKQVNKKVAEDTTFFPHNDGKCWDWLFFKRNHTVKTNEWNYLCRVNLSLKSFETNEFIFKWIHFQMNMQSSEWCFEKQKKNCRLAHEIRITWYRARSFEHFDKCSIYKNVLLFLTYFPEINVEIFQY